MKCDPPKQQLQKQLHEKSSCEILWWNGEDNRHSTQLNFEKYCHTTASHTKKRMLPQKQHLLSSHTHYSHRTLCNTTKVNYDLRANTKIIFKISSFQYEAVVEFKPDSPTVPLSIHSLRSSFGFRHIFCMRILAKASFLLQIHSS